VDVSKLIEKAREAGERRNYDYAIELFLQALKLVPDHFEACRELRAVEIRRAKEKPVGFMDKAKIGAIQMQMNTMYATKKWDSTIEKCEDILKIDPHNYGVLLSLGRACVQAKYRRRAMVIFEDIKGQNAGGNQKQLIEAMRELAIVYEEEGKIKEALDVWGLVNRQVPGDRDATTKLRDLAAKTMSSTIEASALSGVRGGAARSTQTDDQKKEAARRDIENLLEIKTPEDLAAAINLCKEDITKKPDDPRISLTWAKLGDLYKLGNNYAEAKKAYESAREKDPNNWTFKFKIDDLELWKLLSTLKQLEPKVTTDPEVKAQYVKGRLEMYEFKLRSFLDREKQYSTDTKIKFELGSVYYDLAILKNDKSLYDEAITRFQTTNKDPKFRVESGLKLAESFSRKGQYELALKRIEETIAAIPSELKDERWKKLMYTKASILKQMGKRDDAKTCFLEIYEVDVKYRDVSKQIDELSATGAAS